MTTIQVQGVHHTTLVGSTRQSAIDFWQGVLGMPFILEQPNLGKPDENHLYFDPGDGRLLTVFTNESQTDAGRHAPREVGCVEHIAFNVSRATFAMAPARLEARGIEFIQRDRGFMDSIYLRDPKYWGADLPVRRGQFNFDRVTFATGSAEVEAENSEAQLTNLVEILKVYPNVRLKIGGYTGCQRHCVGRIGIRHIWY